MHFNFQGGILSKKNELEIILNNSNIQVVCLNEHWLPNDKINILNSFPNYSLASYYCRKVGIHGGSCILLRDNVDFFIRHDICNLGEDFVFEICGIEIPDLDTIVVSLYRVPKFINFKYFLKKLELLLILLTKGRRLKNIYIASDFNIDTSENCTFPQHKIEFCNLIEVYGFKLNIFTPTRITANSKSCIDNILTLKIKSSNLQQTMNLELGISDHRALFISMLTTCAQSKPTVLNKKTRIFSKTNILNFEQNLELTNWNVSYFNSFDHNFSNFFRCFHNLFEECFPLKFFKNDVKPFKQNKSWVTKGIKISSNKKRELSRMVKHSTNIDFINYVRKYKIIFKAVCNRSKVVSNSNYIKESDNRSKAAWSIVKSELGVKKSVNNFSDIKVNGHILDEGVQIAQYFNKKFVETAKRTGVSPNSHVALKLTEKVQTNASVKFEFKRVTVTDVIKTIKSIKNKKTAGYDEVPVDLMRKISYYIAKPLSVIISQSFEKSVFPDILKYAELKPLFKKGEQHNPDNYRPVSVLPAFSKVFEKLAFEQLSSFLEQNNILTNCQYGFRKGRNTISAISNFIEEVSWGLDSSWNTLGVFCDLSKAFDCVNHDILVQKLSVYNLSPTAINWLKSYLEKRYQRTVIVKNKQKCTSNWSQITDGVPQGSILGPLLFLLYINDLPKNVPNNMILYADDTTAVVKTKFANIINLKVNQALTDLTRWFDANGLKLNREKTQLVKFCTVQSKVRLEEDMVFQGDTISFSESVKFLGLEIDLNLSWNKNIQLFSKRLNSACFQMLILRNSIDIKTRIMIYYAYFHSILQYGIEFWGMASGAKSIFIIQKKFLRIMTFAPFQTSCKPIFKEHKILTVAGLYILKTLEYLKTNFETIQNEQFEHNYNTRFKINLQYPIHHLKLLEKTPGYMSKKLFNKLPQVLKNNINNLNFKSSLTKFLLEKNYYDVEEFLHDNN